MEDSPQSLSGLLATICQHASNPPPYFPLDTGTNSTTSASSFGSGSGSGSSSAAAPSQDPALVTLQLLQRAQHLSNSLSIISDNEPLRDISTSSLRVLFLDSLQAELQLQVRTGCDHAARKQRLRSSLAASIRFLSRLVNLNVLPAQTKNLNLQQLASARLASLLGQDGAATALLDDLQLPTTTGAATMPPRDLKIATFKLERSLKTSLDEFRKVFAQSKLSQRGIEKQPTDAFFDLMLYSPEDMKISNAVGGDGHDGQDSNDENDEESRTNDLPSTSTSTPRDVRQYLLLLLNYHSLRAASSLSSSSQELELLQTMPPVPPDSELTPDAAGNEEDVEWRLDSSLSAGKGWSGPLLNEQGQPMRPFTITSSSVGADRQQIRDSVFRPSHRLPTMSIDEYLEEEARRGNIITGGGAEGVAKATPREARALRAENDGTIEAEEAEEEARREALHWDEFKEENKRGAGNTMNRG